MEKYYKLISPVEAFEKFYPFKRIVLIPPMFLRKHTAIGNKSEYYLDIKTNYEYMILSQDECFEYIKEQKTLKLLFGKY